MLQQIKGINIICKKKNISMMFSNTLDAGDLCSKC